MIERTIFERSWHLDDIAIRSGGDGRTVVAYATPFNTEALISDVQGTYIEKINRNAFNRTLSHGIGNVQVFYNHAKNIGGSPSERFSTPIGLPIEIKPDGKGLLTVTRYANTPNADEVLQLISEGMIRGYSFRGPIFQTAQLGTDPQTGLRLVERTELGLVEYGPTPIPAYQDASVLAIRSASVLDLADLDQEKRAAIAAILNGEAAEAQGTQEIEPALESTSDDGSPSDEEDTQSVTGPSLELEEIAQAQRRRRTAA